MTSFYPNSVQQMPLNTGMGSPPNQVMGGGMLGQTVSPTMPMLPNQVMGGGMFGQVTPQMGQMTQPGMLGQQGNQLAPMSGQAALQMLGNQLGPMFGQITPQQGNQIFGFANPFGPGYQGQTSQSMFGGFGAGGQGQPGLLNGSFNFASPTGGFNSPFAATGRDDRGMANMGDRNRTQSPIRPPAQFPALGPMQSGLGSLFGSQG